MFCESFSFFSTQLSQQPSNHHKSSFAESNLPEVSLQYLSIPPDLSSPFGPSEISRRSGWRDVPATAIWKVYENCVSSTYTINEQNPPGSVLNLHCFKTCQIPLKKITAFVQLKITLDSVSVWYAGICHSLTRREIENNRQQEKWSFLIFFCCPPLWQIHLTGHGFTSMWGSPELNTSKCWIIQLCYSVIQISQCCLPSHKSFLTALASKSPFVSDAFPRKKCSLSISLLSTQGAHFCPILRQIPVVSVPEDFMQHYWNVSEVVIPIPASREICQMPWLLFCICIKKTRSKMFALLFKWNLLSFRNIFNHLCSLFPVLLLLLKQKISTSTILTEEGSSPQLLCSQVMSVLKISTFLFLLYRSNDRSHAFVRGNGLPRGKHRQAWKYKSLLTKETGGCLTERDSAQIGFSVVYSAVCMTNTKRKTHLMSL